MDVIIDSQTINDICRTTRPRREKLQTVLDDFVAAGTLVVLHDEARALLDEWSKTSSVEVIQALLVHWLDLRVDAVRPVQPARLPHATAEFFRHHSFKNTVDKLIVRIALAVDDRNICTRDGDFWDPRDDSRRGKRLAPVARHLREEHGIFVYFLAELIALLRG